MKCPVDSEELVETAVKDQSVWLCHSCGGVFFILDANPGLVLSSGSLKPDQRKQVPVNASNQKNSPTNGAPMKVLKYKGIQIDYCPESNGVWLDGDELELLEANEMKDKKPRGKKKGWLSRVWTDRETDELISAAIDSVFRIFTKS